MKRFFFIGIISSLILSFVLVQCTKDNIAKLDRKESVGITSQPDKSKNLTLIDEAAKRLKKMYSNANKLTMRSSFQESTCGPEDDGLLDCLDEVYRIPLSISGTQTVYHLSLPPMDCGFVCSMDVTFCQYIETGQIIVTFKNFSLDEFILPVSDLCVDWISAYMALPPIKRAEVFQEMLSDYEKAYQLLFMQNWVSDPNNDFDYCPEDGSACSSPYTALQSRYYKAACTKVCLVYDRDCDEKDQVLGFLCQKEIPCYSDGCCRLETGYCLNQETGDVEVCHEAVYFVGECSTPIDNQPCFIELKPCTTIPNCMQ